MLQERSIARDDRLTALLASAWEETRDIVAVQERLLRAAREFFQAQICTIFTLNPSTDDLAAEPQVAGELLHPTGRAVEKPRQEGFTRHVLKTGRLLVEDLELQPEWKSTFSEREQIRSFAAIALGASPRPKPFAVLYIDYREPRRFDAAFEERLDQFAVQASAILQNAWFLDRYRTVIQLGQEINLELGTAENLFHLLVEHVSGILDTSYFFMLASYFGKAGTLDLYYRYQGEMDSEKGKAVAGACRYVVETGRPVFIRRFSEEAAGLPFQTEELEKNDPQDPESLIFVPLILRTVPVGVLSVQSLAPDAYDQEDFRLLELLANHVASALGSIRLFGDLDQLSLTGQLLTEQLDPDQILQRVVDRILEATRADLVVLHPYDQETGVFVDSPSFAGELSSGEVPAPASCRPVNIPYCTASLAQPLFLEDAASFAEPLGAPTGQTSEFQQREGIVSLVAAPLRVGSETVGALFINYRRRQLFSGAQRRVVRGLAIFAAIAIKNARQFGRRMERHRREHDVLHRIDRQLSSTYSPREVFETILEGANEILRAEHASILLLDRDRNRLQIACSIGLEPKSDDQIAFLEEGRGGITRWVFDHRELVNVPDVHTDPRWSHVYRRFLSATVSELDAPLLGPAEGEAGEEAVGVINFESTRASAFGPDDERFVRTLAGQVVLAVKKAQIYELAERRARERRSLIELTREVITQLDLEKLLNLICVKALEASHGAAVVLLLHDVRRGDLVIRAEGGESRHNLGRRLAMREGVIGTSARERKVLNIDPTSPEWRGIYLPIPSSQEMHSALAVPLLSGSRLWGVLNVESPSPGRFQQPEVRLMCAFADMAVLALQNAERYEAAETSRTRLEALQKVSQEIVRQSNDPDRVMQAIAAQAVQLTRSSVTDLDLYEGGQLVRTYLCHAGDPPRVERIELTGEDAPQLPRGIMAWVAENKRPYTTLGDAQDDPLYVGETDVHSEIAVPLLGDNHELIGVLNVDSTELFAFDENYHEFLSLFADDAVIAIQNARSHERFRVLLQVGQRLGELEDWSDRPEACRIVASEAAAQLHCLAVVRLLDGQTGQLVVVRVEGHGKVKPFDRMALTEGINGVVYRTRKSQLLRDTRNLGPNDPVPKLSDPDTRSLLITPIEIYPHYFGNLGLSHPHPDHFHPRDVMLIEGLAGLLAITLLRLEGIRDKRELEERSQQAEVMSWVGEASFSLAHRVGNRLGLIPTWVKDITTILEERRILDAEMKWKLESIATTSRAVLDLSASLKNEVSSFNPNERPVALPTSGLLEEIRRMLSDRNPAVTIRIEVEPGIGSIHAVRRQVMEILENLGSNAVEAMPQGGTLALRAANDGQSVRIEVEDTGCGIPEENLPKIFKLAFSTKGSSGFGLWSAHKWARANGGRLDVRSTVSRGSTFILTLPRADQRLEAEFAQRRRS